LGLNNGSRPRDNLSVLLKNTRGSLKNIDKKILKIMARMI